MLCLNSACDVDKPKKLQNRCLRSCYNIYNPLEIGTDRLHYISRVNNLSLRRDIQLLKIMFLFKSCNKYKKESTRVTRNIDRFIFKTDIVHKEVYSKSPFYCGVALWNKTPLECQNLRIDYCGFGPFCSTRTKLLLSISLLKVLTCIIYQLKDKY